MVKKKDNLASQAGPGDHNSQDMADLEHVSESVSPADRHEDAPQEDVSARIDAAKAFYRSMYAGQDVEPNAFDPATPSPQLPLPERLASCPRCESLNEQVIAAEARAAEAENLYKRMAADFDNFRKRADREKEELLGLGVQKAIETILPAVDDLDRAQANLTPDSDPRSIVESLRLIYNRFAKCLEQIGVKPMEVVGQPFDPRLHEPVQQIVTSELPEGSVLHDLRRGYIMQDKVIRPSLVNVATSSEENMDALESSENSSEELSQASSSGNQIADE